jgi:hypothetical protein
MTATAKELRPFLNSADSLNQPEELRRRMRRDGYLFLRGLLPGDEVLGLRRRILEICQRHGWLVPGVDLMEGRTQHPPTMEGREDYMPVYAEVQLMEEFHLLAHHPALTETLEKLFEEPVLVHPMKIGRISFPKNVQNTTAAHQDYVHIQGSFETYTSWIPLGDVPRDLGGLAVLAGSHKLGVLQPKQAYGAGGLGLDTDQYDLPWHGGEFQAGDALIFLANTIHKALPNLTEDRLRLSTDYRFTGISHAICETNLRLHFSWQVKELTFENLYKNWKTESLKYYWKKLPLHVVPPTEAWYHTARREEKP